MGKSGDGAKWDSLRQVEGWVSPSFRWKEGWVNVIRVWGDRGGRQLQCQSWSKMKGFFYCKIECTKGGGNYVKKTAKKKKSIKIIWPPIIQPVYFYISSFTSTSPPQGRYPSSPCPICLIPPFLFLFFFYFFFKDEFKSGNNVKWIYGMLGFGVINVWRLLLLMASLKLIAYHNLHVFNFRSNLVWMFGLIGLMSG